MKRQILNVITFLRGSEPRNPAADLFKPLKKQVKLLQKYNLPATFLFQYDALLRSDFVKEVKNKPCFELGVWMEMNKPHVLAAGIDWTGRFNWDWHAYCAMTAGYDNKQREKLVDAIFEKFKATFGYYPRVMGAWALDAYTLQYANSRYGIDAYCICKDQWGTDGYNLWGGYYGQAYYPCKLNAFTPAQDKDNQISVPVFRMLGSDPILQYDFKLDPKVGAAMQGVITLEPVYSRDGGGGKKKWVDWYMSENYNGKCLAFGYAQAGQENSFTWRKMRRGIKYQFPLFNELRKQGKIEVETLGDSGRWFKANFSETPATAIVAQNDWTNSGAKSIWYDCKRYRLNLYSDASGTFRIRDFYLFDQAYSERYLNEKCFDNNLTYDNLPIMDGLRYSGDGLFAGIYFLRDGKQLKCSEFVYSEKGENAIIDIKTTTDDSILMTLTPNSITIDGKNICIKPAFSQKAKDVVSAKVNNNVLNFKYNGYEYSLISENRYNDDYSLCGDHIKVKL